MEQTSPIIEVSEIESDRYSNIGFTFRNQSGSVQDLSKTNDLLALKAYTSRKLPGSILPLGALLARRIPSFNQELGENISERKPGTLILTQIAEVLHTDYLLSQESKDVCCQPCTLL